MLELLMIAQIYTGDHYCFIETTTGDVINLDSLCGVGRRQVTPNNQSVLYVESTLRDIELQGFDSSNWDVAALGVVYCEGLAAGLTRDDLTTVMARTVFNNYGSGYAAQEPVAVLAAVAVNARQILCPQFAD